MRKLEIVHKQGSWRLSEQSVTVPGDYTKFLELMLKFLEVKYNIQPAVGIELLLQLKIQIQNTEIQSQIQGAGQAQGGWPGTPERRSDRGRSAELPTDLHKVLHSNT